MGQIAQIWSHINQQNSASYIKMRIFMLGLGLVRRGLYFSFWSSALFLLGWLGTSNTLWAGQTIHFDGTNTGVLQTSPAWASLAAIFPPIWGFKAMRAPERVWALR